MMLSIRLALFTAIIAIIGNERAFAEDDNSRDTSLLQVHVSWIVAHCLAGGRASASLSPFLSLSSEVLSESYYCHFPCIFYYYFKVPLTVIFLHYFASLHYFLTICIHFSKIPHTLTKPNGYEHREALFGIPPYGGSINQFVYYADSDLCDSNVKKTIGYPTRPKDDSGKMKPWPSPYILMVDRGGCTFVQKVRNAQRSGAAAVIIADDTCMCSAGDKCQSDAGVDCETREPVMADDGSGSDITIPSMLLFKQDADVIKTALKANTNVQLEMAWALPNPNKVVEYSLWSTPTDTIAKDFLTLFGETAAALGTRAVFTPRMYLYDGILSNCQGPDGQNECYNLCTNNGR